MDGEDLLERLGGYGADLRGVRDRFINDMALYLRCYRIFLEDDGLNALCGALENEDYAEALNVAHTLKGTAGNLGLTPLYRAAVEIVESLRNGSRDALPEQYEAVREAMVDLPR